MDTTVVHDPAPAPRVRYALAVAVIVAFGLVGLGVHHFTKGGAVTHVTGIQGNDPAGQLRVLIDEYVGLAAKWRSLTPAEKRAASSRTTEIKAAAKYLMSLLPPEKIPAEAARFWPD
jgi:hypothetical protein